jgi:hypothetical protein
MSLLRGVSPRLIIDAISGEDKWCALKFAQINADVGVQWLFSFLSADKKKTYCLYEASSAEEIREVARRAKIPADEIIEVSELRPEMFGLK